MGYDLCPICNSGWNHSTLCATPTPENGAMRVEVQCADGHRFSIREAKITSPSGRTEYNGLSPLK